MLNQPSQDSTVFVVDDDPAMRQSLRWLIESIHLTVETYGTARDFLDDYDPKKPGCLLLDVRMPGMSGLDLQDTLAARNATIPIIVITGYAEVPTAVRALKRGALDFIEKPFSDQHLLDCIQKAIAADQQARQIRAQRADIEVRLAQLTPREREVMYLVVAGRANREIAAELGLSVKTVEVHRARVMEKMKVESLAELIRAVLSL